MNIDGVSSKFGGHEGGFNLKSGLSSIDSVKFEDYAFVAGDGIPEIRFTLTPPSELDYTGELATIVVHFWEAVKVTPEGGTSSSANFIANNYIDIKIDR